jgi:hypothetical protein
MAKKKKSAQPETGGGGDSHASASASGHAGGHANGSSKPAGEPSTSALIICRNK